VWHRVVADPAAPAGALVISLDFELHWGVRDQHHVTGTYTQHLLGARAVVPQLLECFAGYDIHATWATVGFLFAESRDELESYHPAHRPRYADPGLDPYKERLGEGEHDDPLHFAPSLIRMIQQTPGQEIATHTYSHYYCLEAGHDAETFRQDLQSAIAIGRARGVEIASIVFPRNQWNPDYAPLLLAAGINCYRGNQPGWMYRAAGAGAESLLKRTARLIDAHAPLTRWHGSTVGEESAKPGVRNVPATCFLRSVESFPHQANGRRLRRIIEGLTDAARAGRVFHLWWHPHNFGLRPVDNMAMLRLVLEHYRRLRDQYGMVSSTMRTAASYPACAAPDTETDV
jgi:peptidoglycan/xylan/chitin deacetylase (PgdA/CDA1 family)